MPTSPRATSPACRPFGSPHLRPQRLTPTSSGPSPRRGSRRFRRRDGLRWTRREARCRWFAPPEPPPRSRKIACRDSRGNGGSNPIAYQSVTDPLVVPTAKPPVRRRTDSVGHPDAPHGSASSPPGRYVFGDAVANRPAQVEAGPSASVASTPRHNRDTPTPAGARGQTRGKDRPQEGGTRMRMSSVRALGLSRCGGHRGSTMTNASPSRRGRQGLGVVAWRRAPPRASGSRAGGANRNAQPRVPGAR